MLVQIDYGIDFATSFHLGTGIRQGLIDRTVIRNKDSHLYIPASTFKGVVREHCEQVLRFYTPDDPKRVASPHDEYAALAEFGKKPTLLSRIFGSPFYPGTIRFDDASLQDTHWQAGYQKIQTSISTQVRIDRTTRIAANEALYNSEFGTRDLIFEGRIKGQINCTPIASLAGPDAASSQETDAFTPTYSLLLLLVGLLLVEQLGGNKSTGKGQCICTIHNLQLDRQICAEEQWRSWIEQLDVLGDYMRDEKGA